MIRKYIQRAKRGFSDEDLWDAGCFICKIIRDVLEEFINTNKNGIPIEYLSEAEKTHPNVTREEQEKIAEKKWHSELMEIKTYFDDYLNDGMPNLAWNKYCEVMEKKYGYAWTLPSAKDEEDIKLSKAWIEEDNKNYQYRLKQLHKGFELLEKHIEELWW